MSEVRIENWALRQDGIPHKAPEWQDQRLTGRVYGHPAFEDGAVVQTSEVLSLDLPNRKVYARKRVYTLGKPDPEFIRFLWAGGYPSAKEVAALAT